VEDGDQIVTLGVHMLEVGQKVRAIMGQTVGQQ
jgi:hypothetical protein